MDANTIINTATPIIAPLLTAAVKFISPKIPTWLLPIICTVLGTLGNYVAQVATSNQSNVWAAVGLGLAGIGVREIIDQLKPKPAV